MAADFFKMGTIIGLIFCGLVMSGKMVIVESALYESPDIILKFSECLIESMSQSQSFTYDELNNMVEMKDVMAESLLSPRKTLAFSKSVAVALITSFADLIIHDDVQKNFYRKQIYASSLEECSVRVARYRDIEFINEALRILSIIENNKAVKYEEKSAFDGPASSYFDTLSLAQASGVDNSFAVQPSPVQNPPVSQRFYSNDKTISEQKVPNFENPYLPSLTLPPQAPFDSQYEIQPASQMDFSSGLATNMQAGNFPARFGLFDASQTGGFSSGFISSSKSDDFFVGSDSSRMTQPGTSLSGSQPEKFPSDYDTDRITFASNRPVVSSYNKSPQIGPINEGGDSQTFYEGVNIPQTKESSVIVIPPKRNDQFVPDKQSSQNPQRGAKFDKSEQIYPQPETVEQQPQNYNIDESVYPQFNEKQTDFDFEYPPLSPEDRKDEIFSISLGQYLSKSEAFRNFFCGETATEDKVDISHSVIKSSVADYGTHLASLVASITSSALSELSDEGLCNNYATTISEAIAEILDENNILDANAETVASKMELNLKRRQIIPTEPQYPATFSDYFPQNISEIETDAAAENIESSPFTEKTSRRNRKKTKRPKIVTQADTNSVSDYEYTNPMTVIYRSTSLSTKRPDCTAQPVKTPEWAPDGTIKQRALADYLTKAFYDTVKSFISEESEPEESDQEETSSIDEIIDDDSKYTTEDCCDEPQTPRKQKNKSTTVQSNIVTTSADQFQDDDDDEEDYVPRITEDEDVDFYQDKTVTLQEDSEESKIKMTPVELQPSFRDPVSKSGDSNVGFLPNYDTVSYDPYYIDPRIELSRKMSEIAKFTIDHIRSQNFDLGTMCTQINQLAPLVDILALDYCEPIAADDYLLNVLQAASRILEGKQKNKFTTLQLNTISTSVDQSQEDYSPSVAEDKYTISYLQDKTTSFQEDSAGFNINTSPVELQPSFQDPFPKSEDSNIGFQPNSDTTSSDSYFADPRLELTNKVSEITKTSISYIRSQNFEIGTMCAQINQLSPEVDIPALTYCEPIAAADYLLNALLALINKLNYN